MRKFLLIFSFCIFAAITASAQKVVTLPTMMMDAVFLTGKADPYVGKQFVYCKLSGNYETWATPYPIKDGRIRDGKYKSSNTAFAAYQDSLQAYSGHLVTFMKFCRIGKWPGIIFQTENGDSIFYTANTRVQAEFTSFDCLRIVREALMGKKFVYSKIPNSDPAYALPYINLKDEVLTELEEGSEWEMKDVTVAYYKDGETPVQSTYSHLAVLLHNDKYGDVVVPVISNSIDGIDIGNNPHGFMLGAFKEKVKGGKAKSLLKKFGI